MSVKTLDPRSVPVASVDTHLPAAAADQLQLQALRQRFAIPPDWEPEFRRELAFMDRPDSLAAVLILLVLHNEPTVLLTQRASHLSTHSGQIAFPGGKFDPSDASLVHTALREAHEEVGVSPEAVEILGQLPTYVTGSAFHVTPVVGVVHPGFLLHPNEDEVTDVFEVPLSFLMNPSHHRHHHVVWQGVPRQWLSMPYPADTQERFIWGATAGMLRNLYRFLQA